MEYNPIDMNKRSNFLWRWDVKPIDFNIIVYMCVRVCFEGRVNPNKCIFN